MQRFSNIEALVPFAKLRAKRYFFDGRMNANSMETLRACNHFFYSAGWPVALIVGFTRDVGHHSGGWWKNPDYERCFHLSMSALDPETMGSLPRDRKSFLRMARAFFGDDIKYSWVEPPYSVAGKSADVWHYRVFCDEAWGAIKPRGEVYSKELTESGWKSFSDLHDNELEEP